MIPASNDDTVPGDFVLIEWTDAAFHMDSIPGTPVLETAGWIVESNNDAVTVASERDLDQTFHRAHTTIPRVLIQAIRRLSILTE